MANNHRGPSELWDKYRHFLIETTDEHGKTRLVQNVSKIDRLSKQAAYFVLRSNCISDPFEALRIYRRRGVVEQDFNQLKNWVDGDRLHVGANSLHGKVLVNTLATALRMMILVTAKRQRMGQRFYLCHTSALFRASRAAWTALSALYRDQLLQNFFRFQHDFITHSTRGFAGTLA
ncbi:MAG: hypothetical protein J6S08_05985 [Duodenibacillus sp.]|nr:hypothetical protein [Duodenibacillus sp.]